MLTASALNLAVSLQRQFAFVFAVGCLPRQKGSSPLASYSSGSKATNLLRRWSPYDGALKCVHRVSEEAVWALSYSLVKPVQLFLLLNGHI